MRRRTVIPLVVGSAVLCLVSVLAGACASAGTDENRVHVLTSLALFGDMVQQVGGDRVTVESLVPASGDPHTFQPSPQDIRKITQARLIVVNGLGVEAAMERTIEKNMRRGAQTVRLADGLQALQTASEEEPGAIEDNPHFWLNVRYGMRYVERIRDGLIAVDPDGAETYRRNAEAYLRVLADLDREVEATINTVPPARRKLITFHDAFPYFAQRYGLEVIAVVIKSPGREASAQEVADLAREIRQYNIPTVYKEPQFNARILELAARDAGVQVRSLYSDAFSDEVRSYVDLMRYNARQIAEGLK